MPEMKLLFLTNYFPNTREPTRGVFNLQQAQALARRCEVRVVSPVQWSPVYLSHGAGPTPVQRRVIRGALTAEHPPYFLTPGFGRNTHAFQMAAQVLPAIDRIRKDFRFDVLLAVWAFPDVVVGALAARLWKLPLLAEVIGSDINLQARYP